LYVVETLVQGVQVHEVPGVFRGFGDLLQGFLVGEDDVRESAGKKPFGDFGSRTSPYGVVIEPDDQTASRLPAKLIDELSLSACNLRSHEAQAEKSRLAKSEYLLIAFCQSYPLARLNLLLDPVQVVDDLSTGRDISHWGDLSELPFRVDEVAGLYESIDGSPRD
jgi:hypothetical protein